ncbi:hypothetical protein ACSBR2_035282 [Camellia fascicularis]
MYQTYAPTVEQVKQRPSGRVYAVTTLNQSPVLSVMRGNFLLFKSIANLLIDTSASLSFISSAFALILGL